MTGRLGVTARTVSATTVSAASKRFGAGTGETIYWCRGQEASFPFLPADLPTEATIVGIVDSVNIPS